MTDEQMRIAIAKSVGWTDLHFRGGKGKCVSLVGRKRGYTFKMPRHVPDYPNCLNAMHEVEKKLEQESEVVEYGIEVLKAIERAKIISVEGEPKWGLIIHATARQRAESYLRVKGLWKEWKPWTV